MGEIHLSKYSDNRPRLDSGFHQLKLLSTEAVLAFDEHILCGRCVHAFGTTISGTSSVIRMIAVPSQGTAVSQISVLQIPLVCMRIVSRIGRVEPRIVQPVPGRGILGTHILVDSRVFLSGCIIRLGGHVSVSSWDLVATVRLHVIDVEVIVRAGVRLQLGFYLLLLLAFALARSNADGEQYRYQEDQDDSTSYHDV